MSRPDIRSELGHRRGPYLAWNPVNRPMIWQWREAFGDHNLLYSDEAFARSRGFLDVISPPAMIQGWCLPAVHRAYPQGSAPERPYGVFDTMAAAGFTGNVAVAYRQQFVKPVAVGTQLHYHVEPVDISSPKTTRLGEGHFVTCLETYADEHNTTVYESHTTYLQFKPGDETLSQVPVNPAQEVSPPEHYAGEVTLSQVPAELAQNAGLGPMTIPISASRIASCALASLDWMPVHHSRDAAVAQGQPDVFMNILTTAGFVSRFLTDCAGPGSLLSAMNLTLGVPCYPGDTLVLTGRVEDAADGVKIGFEGRNNLGTHVSGDAVLTLN